MTDPTVQGLSYLCTVGAVCVTWHVIFAVIVIARYKAYQSGGWREALFGRQA